MSRFVRPALLALLVLLSVTPAAQASDERDLEPLPPVVVFPEPDPFTAESIGRVVKRLTTRNDFTRHERTLVHRFHHWAIPALDAEVKVEGSGNLERRLVSLLTLLAMRQEHGAHERLGRSLAHINTCCGTDTQDPWAIALSALATGAWRWTEGTQKWNPNRLVPDQVVGAGPHKAWRAAVRDSSLMLASRALRNDGPRTNWQIRVCSLLAMAKRGGDRLAKTLEQADLSKAKDEIKEADLVARAFLGIGDLERYEPLLRRRKDEGNSMPRAAALAVAISLLSEPSPAWAGDTDRMLAMLESALAASTVEKNTPEIVFALGVLAWRSQLDWDRAWHRLFDIAVKKSSKRVEATAAAQVLLFCDAARGLPRMMRKAQRSSGRHLYEPVLASFLLKCGAAESPEAQAVAREWITDRSVRPVGKPEWDVRFYGVLGLCRALARQAGMDADVRQGIVDDLITAYDKVLHPEAPFRAALGRMLDREGRQLRNDVGRLLSRGALEALESDFTCPYAFLARDLKDVAAHRVNRWMEELFNFAGIPDSSPGTPVRGHVPQRYLRDHLRQFPYFRRLDFFEDRGARPPLDYDESQPGVIER